MSDKTITLQLLRQSSDDLVREAGLVPPEGRLWRPAEGQWSVHECLTHLRDIEQQLFLPRIRRTVEEDQPALPAFDEVAYHREHWTGAEPFETTLSQFVEARAEIVRLLAEAPDWTRRGLHAARGPITLAWQADYDLGHTWEHMSQMLRARLAYELTLR